MLTHTGTLPIETPRLLLRQFSYTDEGDVLAHWASDPAVQSWYGEPVYTTQQEVKALLSRYIADYEKQDVYRWAIILRETGVCIGQIAYFLVDSTHHFAEMEYCIGSDFQGKGFATEAAKAVIRFGFQKIKLHKVQASHKAANTASHKVIEKCGFTYEGTLRDYFYEDGAYVDRLYYSILKEEFDVLRRQLISFIN